ncbi:hypothetical protein FM104_12170 [Microbacterium esteraromaticum]|uniref:Uncharacterized protein n=1 Tax=Microbacterium esteraromaticum TaxID=57043 RepID=A0A1R4KET1_9MICO|nr:hypothetical protein [Microbacterium esteraromaticum]SJN42685.1 hypothetical protein FM104_12170 [Microbacterium esteraromaticum]
MFKKFFRPIVALAAICTLSLGLTACAQSEEDVDAYRDALAGVPGVIDVTASVQRPLPFTTTASMKVTIPADEKVLDAVVKAACGQVQMATASVYFEFHVKADAATVMM